MILLIWVFLLVVWNDALSGICIWCSCSFHYIALRIGLLWINSSHFALGNWWLIGKSLFIFFVLQFFLVFFENFLCHAWNCLFAKLLRIYFIVWWLVGAWLNIWSIDLIRVFNSRFTITSWSIQSLNNCTRLICLPSLSLGSIKQGLQLLFTIIYWILNIYI